MKYTILFLLGFCTNSFAKEQTQVYLKMPNSECANCFVGLGLLDELAISYTILAQAESKEIVEKQLKRSFPNALKNPIVENQKLYDKLNKEVRGELIVLRKGKEVFRCLMVAIPSQENEIRELFKQIPSNNDKASKKAYQEYQLTEIGNIGNKPHFRSINEDYLLLFNPIDQKVHLLDRTYKGLKTINLEDKFTSKSLILEYDGQEALDYMGKDQEMLSEVKFSNLRLLEQSEIMFLMTFVTADPTTEPTYNEAGQEERHYGKRTLLVHYDILSETVLSKRSVDTNEEVFYRDGYIVNIRKQPLLTDKGYIFLFIRILENENVELSNSYFMGYFTPTGTDSLKFDSFVELKYPFGEKPINQQDWHFSGQYLCAMGNGVKIYDLVNGKEVALDIYNAPLLQPRKNYAHSIGEIKKINENRIEILLKDETCTYWVAVNPLNGKTLSVVKIIKEKKSIQAKTGYGFTFNNDIIRLQKVDGIMQFRVYSRERLQIN